MAQKRLRSGFTTGACAAAAAQAALRHLATGTAVSTVHIPFPDGIHRTFSIYRSSLSQLNGLPAATASVMKDAGDDPDVTNGAEIIATVSLPLKRHAADKAEPAPFLLTFLAGEGVGTVTKPGLALPVGEPAINPVPRQMIRDALFEALAAEPLASAMRGTVQNLTVCISIANGRELAEKTLNHRLGIVGGLSILGTTGIVRPVSAEAWTATISASMSVAAQTGCREIVLSTGRTSEKAAQAVLTLPVEAYAMMGDYLEFSLLEAQRYGFHKIHLAAMWAKIVKAAMRIPQTHVRHGALEAGEAAHFIGNLLHDSSLGAQLADANTAREIYQRLSEAGRTDAVSAVCEAAKSYAQETARLPVDIYLITSPGKVAAHV